jgi:hypothetical protein
MKLPFKFFLNLSYVPASTEMYLLQSGADWLQVFFDKFIIILGDLLHVCTMYHWKGSMNIFSKIP